MLDVTKATISRETMLCYLSSTLSFLMLPGTSEKRSGAHAPKIKKVKVNFSGADVELE